LDEAAESVDRRTVRSLTAAGAAAPGSAPLQEGYGLRLMRFPSAVRRDPSVDAWFCKADDPLRRFAQPWFEQMRGCGADVRELLHDLHPTACVGDAAFGYVNAFSAHVNVGFFFGAMLEDPAGLLEGTGKRMRHVKLRWGQHVNEAALRALIAAAYRDIRLRVVSENATN
jgi:hypothetical protein